MSTNRNTPGLAPSGCGNSRSAAIGQNNPREAAGPSSGAAVANDTAGGVGALRKHVSATGRVTWTLLVNGTVEVTMTTATLLSARRAERQIIEALIALNIYDLPESMTQRQWHALIVDRLKHVATPVGRARTTDAAWRRPPWWRRWFARAA